MNAAFTPYPPGLAGRRARIGGHGNVSGTQEHQESWLGALHPFMINSELTGNTL